MTKASCDANGQVRLLPFKDGKRPLLVANYDQDGVLTSVIERIEPSEHTVARQAADGHLTIITTTKR